MLASLLGTSRWHVVPDVVAPRDADLGSASRECVLRLSKGVLALAGLDASLFGKLELSAEQSLEDEVDVGVLYVVCRVDFLTLGWDVLFLRAAGGKKEKTRQTKEVH